MIASTSPWAHLTQDPKETQSTVNDVLARHNGKRTQVKAKDPSITGSFDEPVRKGRKPEVSKQHPAVLKCRELYQTGMPLHRVGIEAGVEYAILARWFDKGWMDLPRKRKI